MPPSIKPYAITPYNFVPMPDRIVTGDPLPRWNSYASDRHTGWLDVEYTTLTPTYTRAARGAGDPADPPDFFHHFDEQRTPVLPGSSLRGMVRSVFEILTYSALDSISDRTLSYRFFASGQRELREYYSGADAALGTFDTSRLFAGVLEQSGLDYQMNVGNTSAPSADKGFVVVSVNDPGLRRYIRTSSQPHQPYRHMAPLYETQQVWVRLTGTATLLRGQQEIECPSADLAAPHSSGAVEGILLFHGKDIASRRWYQVILKPSSPPLATYELPQSVYRDYRAWGQMAHGKRFGGQDAPRMITLGAPAFTLVDRSSSKVTALGANLMLTLRYRRSLKDVARDAYSAADGLDMTQTVFGYVGNDNSIPPVRSRIAFEDALLVAAPNGIWMEVSAVRIPDILSSPKPTSIQTYLTQSTSEVEPLRHWDSPNVRIRGAKRYWQRSPSSAENSLRTAGDMAIGTQQTKIKPIRAQVKFKGRVRFTNLTSVELAALYASIQLPEGLAHKFGMGKNLGLGALDVSIVKVNLIDTERRYRTLDNAESYHSEEYGRTKLVDGYTELIKRIYPNSKLEKQTSLWNSRRLKDFAGLCSWEVRLEDDLTRQVAIQDSRNDTDEDTWKHNDDQWRRRLVLPSASDLIQEGRLMRQPSDVITPRLEKMIAAKTFPAVAATQQTKFEYKVGDSVTGRILPGYIVELLDTSGSSTGVRLRNLPVMMHATGDILQFKVVELRDGKISRVKKA